MRLAIILILFTVPGCSSFRTTAVDRSENDCLVANPTCPLKGIPVALRVPTHLELRVIESAYWEKRNQPGAKPTLVPLSTCHPTRTVTHRICETEKIFLVDPVRPGAGTMNYGFTFQSNSGTEAGKGAAGKGYLQNVQYRIDDQTIQQSADLFSNSIGLITALQTAAANRANLNTANLITTERAVAYARFDINSASFEHDVSTFLDCHVNLAHEANSICPQVCSAKQCP